jgi:hypothetical protein
MKPVNPQRRPPPRGLGLATATTSATFLPHWEHRIRVDGAVFVLPADRRYTDSRALTETAR